MADSSDQQNRLGTAFHESFALNRPAMQQVLEIALYDPSQVTYEVLRERTDLGKNYVKAMPRYCVGCGLIDADYSPTVFGRLAAEHDPALQKPQTQWIMHYFLAVDDGPGPVFWHDLVARHIVFGDFIDAEQVARWVSETLEGLGSRQLADRTLRDTARVFLKTYSNDDGLNQIGLVSELEDKQGSYAVRKPSSPGTWVIGAALADLWDRRWRGRATVNLADVTEELGDLFLIGSSGLSGALRELQKHDLVDIYRVAPPYQVAGSWIDSSEMWTRLYD